MPTANSVEKLKIQTRRPSTPGDLLADLLDGNALTQAVVAQKLGVRRQSIHDVVHNKRPLTVDMAHRLGRYFGNGPTIWLRLQQTVELWDALHTDTKTYADIEPMKQQAA